MVAVPAVGADQPEQHPQGRGLAGAVRAEEAGDPARLDREVEVVDGGEGAEPLGEAADLDPRPAVSVRLSVRHRGLSSSSRRRGRSRATAFGHAGVAERQPGPGAHAARAPRRSGAPHGRRASRRVLLRTGADYDRVAAASSLGVALTAGTALFVAAEFSFVALDRPHGPAGRRRRRPPGARSVLASLRQLSTQLSAAQVGITLTTLVVGFLAEPAIGRLLMRPAAAGSGCPRDGVVGWSRRPRPCVIATVFSMVFGELVPQVPRHRRAAGDRQGRGRRPVRVFAVVDPAADHRCSTARPTRVLRALGIEPQEELLRRPQPAGARVAGPARRPRQGTLDADTAGS